MVLVSIVREIELIIWFPNFPVMPSYKIVPRKSLESLCKLMGLGLAVGLTLALGYVPRDAIRRAGSMPACRAFDRNVCRQAWLGLSSGSVTPSERTHTPRTSRAFTAGLRFGLN